MPENLWEGWFVMVAIIVVAGALIGYFMTRSYHVNQEERLHSWVSTTVATLLVTAFLSCIYWGGRLVQMAAYFQIVNHTQTTTETPSPPRFQ